MSNRDLGKTQSAPELQEPTKIDMPAAAMYLDIARQAHEKGDTSGFQAARTMLVVSMGLSSSTR